MLLPLVSEGAIGIATLDKYCVQHLHGTTIIESEWVRDWKMGVSGAFSCTTIITPAVSVSQNNVRCQIRIVLGQRLQSLAHSGVSINRSSWSVIPSLLRDSVLFVMRDKR